MKITCGIYLYSALTGKILICHATNARWNMWTIPKGLQDSGEDLFAVAVRELQEETGVNIQDLHVIKTQQLPPIKYQKQDKMLESFLVITSTDLDNHTFISNLVEPTKTPEVDKWKWVSLNEAGKWLHESQVKQLEVIGELVKGV
jgi:8-oxo-dGTP pyrophosphatase MutT (NUDIX family)